MKSTIFFLLTLCIISCDIKDKGKNETECMTIKKFSGKNYAFFDEYYVGDRLISKIHVKDSLVGLSQDEFMTTKIPMPETISKKIMIQQLKGNISIYDLIDQLLLMLEISDRLKKTTHLKVFDFLEIVDVNDFEGKSIEYAYGQPISYLIYPKLLKIVEDCNLDEVSFKHIKHITKGKKYEISVQFCANIFVFDIVPDRDNTYLQIWPNLQKISNKNLKFAN